jgi:hypothetical protein
MLYLAYVADDTLLVKVALRADAVGGGLRVDRPQLVEDVEDISRFLEDVAAEIHPVLLEVRIEYKFMQARCTLLLLAYADLHTHSNKDM